MEKNAKVIFSAALGKNLTEEMEQEDGKEEEVETHENKKGEESA